MAPNQRNAAEQILSTLGAAPALIEHYDPNEIEAIPLAAVQVRLIELGLTPAMPPELQRIVMKSTPSPATDVLRALVDESEYLQPQSVETRPLGEVTTCLQRRGINYRAGVAAVIDLVGEHASVDATEHQPKVRSIKSARLRGVIQSHCLFGKLNPKHIDRLMSCIIEKSVRRGSTIFAKDDPGSSLFAIRKGAVKITVPSADGRDAEFNRVTKGDIFGEIALLDGGPRTADAVAITDCEMFVIERRDFLPLVREEPEIALKLIEILCARLRQTSQQAESLMFLSLAGRLAKALLRLSDGDSAAREQKVAVTQKDLGNVIGMSRESTNRQLRLWERHGWVRLERGEITILSVKALEKIAESDSEGA